MTVSEALAWIFRQAMVVSTHDTGCDPARRATSLVMHTASMEIGMQYGRS